MGESSELTELLSFEIEEGGGKNSQAALNRKRRQVVLATTATEMWATGR